MNLATTFFSSQQNNLSIGYEKLPGINLSFFDGSSSEAKSQNQLSEDFLAYRYASKDGILTFVVCDGVGQSTDSGVAARLLGKYLVNDLPNLGGRKKAIEDYVNKLRGKIAEKIDSIPLPVARDDPLYPYYARSRNETGAQVKFACGIIDFVNSKMHIYWAGDIHFIIYDKNSNATFLWKDDNSQFFSTKGNHSLSFSEHEERLQDISRISISSDGIRNYFEEVSSNKYSLTDENFIRKVYDEGKDDLTVLNIELDGSKTQQLLKPEVQSNDVFIKWPLEKKTENYRLYYIKNGIIKEIQDLPIGQNRFNIPAGLDTTDFDIQALSRNYYSSERFSVIRNARLIKNPKLPLPTSEIHIPSINISSVGRTDDSRPTPKSLYPRESPGASDMIRIKPKFDLKYILIGTFIILAIAVVAYSLFGHYSFIIPLRPTQPQVTQLSRDTLAPLLPEGTAPPTIHSTVTNPPIESSPIITVPPLAPEAVTKTPTYFPENYGLLNECQQQNFPEGWVIYTVNPDDTFYGIARKYGTEYSLLMDVNCYQDPRTLHAGNVLAVPPSR